MQTAATKFVAFWSYRDRDPPKVLQAAEHALDGVAVAIEERREAILPPAIGLRRDVRRSPCRGAGVAMCNLAAGEHDGRHWVSISTWIFRRGARRYRSVL
jgi:hypothetical protein